MLETRLSDQLHEIRRTDQRGRRPRGLRAEPTTTRQAVASCWLCPGLLLSEAPT